jgi:hypothetical protein
MRVFSRSVYMQQRNSTLFLGFTVLHSAKYRSQDAGRFRG